MTLACADASSRAAVAASAAMAAVAVTKASCPAPGPAVPAAAACCGWALIGKACVCPPPFTPRLTGQQVTAHVWGAMSVKSPGAGSGSTGGCQGLGCGQRCRQWPQGCCCQLTSAHQALAHLCHGTS